MEETQQDNLYVSPFEDRCQGSRDPNRYLVAMNVAAAKVPARFGNRGSYTLDSINAFDLAEVAEAHLGQMNLIEVSSFCGPEGLLWGRDVAVHPKLRSTKLFDVAMWDGTSAPVYDGEPLIDAAKALFGSGVERKFPLAPGTHCPTASKNISAAGPVVLYAACAIGYRDVSCPCASIIMEDVGTLVGEPAAARADIIRNVAASVAAVASNQRTNYTEIFVAFRSVAVAEGEVGCAISMMPYFTLARRAVPGGSVPALVGTSLDAWARSSTP